MRKKLAKLEGYNGILDDIKYLLDKAKAQAYKAVDNIRVQTYWQIGERIVREELQHKERADYGEKLIESLAKDIGFGKVNLHYMVKFYKTYPIIQTVSEQLSWSHYVELVYLENKQERDFYENQSISNSWSIRKLKQEIKNKLYYHVKKEGKLVTTTSISKVPAAEEIFKEVYNFEFLELKQSHSESELKKALLTKLEEFLQELGPDFFVGRREAPVLISGNYDKVDLELFHAGLLCYILVEIKTEKFRHSHVSQMYSYLNWYKENKLQHGQRDPVGLIICKTKDDETVHYALGDLKKEIFVAEYKKAGQYVLSLDEATGKLLPAKVNALLDHGIKPIYEMATEDGRAINTTAEHPYLVKLYDKELCEKYAVNVWNKEADEFNAYCTRWVEVKDLDIAQSLLSNPSSSAINSLPLNSVTLDSSKSIAFINFSALGGCEIKTIMPENWAGGNKTESRKSLSLDNKISPLSSAKDASLPFLVPFSAYSAEYLFDTSDFLSNSGIFSSSRNLSIADTMASAYYLSCPFQSVLNHALAQTWIIIPNDFFGRDTISYKLNDITNQNSGASESRLSVADFAISYNVFANFNSHNKINNTDEIFKFIEIAVPNYETGSITFEKIISIKQLPPQHVYDLSIEGTRNFIANDIVAHNTYLATSSGNVGVGLTNPNYLLQTASGTDGRSVNLSNVLYVNGSSGILMLARCIPI